MTSAVIFPEALNTVKAVVRQEPLGLQRARFRSGTQTLLPHHEEAFGKCDEAILQWVSNLYIVRPRSQKVIQVTYHLATTSQETAQYGSSYVRSRSEVPAIAIERTNEEYADARFLPSMITFKAEHTSPDGKDKIVLSPREIPWNVQYTLSLWTKFQEDMNYLKAEILKRLHRHDQILIENQPIDLKLVSTSDNSDLEPGQGAEKVIRYDIIVEMETGINNDSVVVNSTESLILDFNTAKSFQPDQLEQIDALAASADGQAPGLEGPLFEPDTIDLERIQSLSSRRSTV